jgi:hypothetical protein
MFIVLGKTDCKMNFWAIFEKGERGERRVESGEWPSPWPSPRGRGDWEERGELGFDGRLVGEELELDAKGLDGDGFG